MQLRTSGNKAVIAETKGDIISSNNFNIKLRSPLKRADIIFYFPFYILLQNILFYITIAYIINITTFYFINTFSNILYYK